MGNPIIYTVTMPSGNTYDLVDQGARDLIKELLNFHEWLGVTTSEIDDGSTTNPVLINGEEVTAVAGDVVSRDSDHKDFVLSSTGVWQNFGELSGLGALAFKDSASGSYTPAGTLSVHFTGASTTSTGKFIPSGSVSAHFTGASTTSTGTFIPAGTISGTTLGTKTISEFHSAGTLASCTMPTFTVSNGNLTITDGSYTAGTLPSGQNVTVGDGSVTTQGTFSGIEGNLSVTGTSNGSIDTATFTGIEGDISVTGTSNGSIDTATFTGTAATVTVS